MIIGIGIDSVDINRFEPWTHFTHQRLHRIFSDTEIAYALSNPSKSAERLSARFAAREALYKALGSCMSNPIPFLTLCASCTVERATVPLLHIKWDRLTPWLSCNTFPSVFLSLTHTHTVSTAFVILEHPNTHRSPN